MKLMLIFALFPLLLYGQSTPTKYDPAEEAARNKAKIERIRANPEAYRAQGGNPEQVLAEADRLANPAPEPKPVLAQRPPFAARQTYRLVQSEAVPIENAHPSAEATRAETQNFQTKFPLSQTVFQRGQESNAVRLFIPERHDLRARELRMNDGKAVDWQIVREDCPQCSKTLHLTLERETATECVYVLRDEDSSGIFAYRMVFQLQNP